MGASKDIDPPDWVDPDDAPELTDEFFERADEFQGEKLSKRAQAGQDEAGGEHGKSPGAGSPSGPSE